ncbi:glycoside hydrolase family 3 N-terminal domain-containing protein [Bdellovibrio sp. HCB337]|uniref:glycoside hydrolase family 3 N-terminal domain-containing protein n=1 Tax=Bdellovibrio sp. HCB337 TaxID=3394358 RepID=UPI0039A4AFB0
MRPFKRSFLSLTLSAATLLLTACGAQLPSDLNRDRDHEHEEDFYMASVEDQDPSTDPNRSKLGYFFLVEQFNVGANSSMLKAIKNNPPGGILFWNGNSADASAVRESVRAYSAQAESMKLKPLLFSTDYEGGALNKTPSGSSVPGVQRFTKGFSALAHPRWLGVSVQDYDMELCGLHGKIMAEELKSVGINYPLSVVSDLATQALTSVRAISKNSEDASRCVTKILEEFVKTKDVIFVTKHFPGLGLTKGDTHDGTVTAATTDEATLQEHLKPFIDLVTFSKAKKSEGLLSVMTTHAKFMAYDDENLTTESPKTINGLLKKRMEFTGLVVSDAMWMGEYGNMKSAQLMPVYLNSFLSGIDLLMIPGARFAESINYFRKVYDGTLSEEEKNQLTKRTGKSWEDTHKKFMERITESLAAHDRARGAIKAPHTYLSSQAPTNLTAESRTRYNQILSELSIRGNSLKKN